MKIKISGNLVLALLIPLAVGTLSALLTGDAMMSYATLEKPILSPPAWVFPLVWTILYLLMGVSSWLIWSSEDPGREKALVYYSIQLFFNFCWSFLFFSFSAYLIAFVWLLAMILLILLMILSFCRINRTAAYLQLPYLVWCLFAAYLNFGVYLLQR